MGSFCHSCQVCCFVVSDKTKYFRSINSHFIIVPDQPQMSTADWLVLNTLKCMTILSLIWTYTTLIRPRHLVRIISNSALMHIPSFVLFLHFEFKCWKYWIGLELINLVYQQIKTIIDVCYSLFLNVQGLDAILNLSLIHIKF